MEISEKEILHIANLACINIKDDEMAEYKRNLQDILEFAKIIDRVDTHNIKEDICVSNNVNILREDEVEEFKNKKALLQNAPEQENNMFIIPKVIN